MKYNKKLLEEGTLEEVDGYLVERTANSWEFIQELPQWGWILYQRDPNRFEPVISRFIAEWSFKAPNPAWRKAADENNHVTIYRTLMRKEYVTKASSWGKAVQNWTKTFIENMPYETELEFQKQTLWDLNTDEILTAIFEKQPGGKEIVSSQLQRVRWRDETFPDLAAAVEKAGDEELQLVLYKRLHSIADWEKDMIAWSKEITDDEALNQKLIDHTLEGDLWDWEHAFYNLAKSAGKRVAPFLTVRAKEDPPTWNQQPWKKILDLIEDEKWDEPELWRQIVRKRLRADEWNKIVARALNTTPLDIAQVMSITNVPADWGLGLKPFTPEVAQKLYKLSPDLAMSLSGHYVPQYNQHHEEVFKTAIANEDFAFADLLVAKVMTVRAPWHFRRNLKTLDAFIEYYNALPDDELTDRAVTILSQLPAAPIFGYYANDLIKFFTSDPNRLKDASVAPLLEGEHHASKMLGIKILRLDPVRAADPKLFRHLRAALFWRSKRPLQIAAAELIAALGVTGTYATECLGVLREAMELEQRWFPRDRIVKGLGEILATNPEFRSEKEKPVIYRRGA